ncbi:hypothetical protein BW12_10045 [Bifidobacterium sp. UTCIF-3]|nr:hypothetical protein BW09_09185 [Bifidobacterium sp. UTCIF-1]TPF79326.1 hypothetical protein BW08_10500 [Bifidobacterium sp. UTCIF-24]TPF81476.1 hypothetical protein BW12_10045 [Bifidobacterium sp. UTCIF-3]TPF84337.1 hypothetical protein BW07_05050 [Bifidobacterium sp. UTCIF-36]TPF91046.1 hypothetical protein BW10_02185 [Bifidobacterium sp. UTBIF-56]
MTATFLLLLLRLIHAADLGAPSDPVDDGEHDAEHDDQDSQDGDDAEQPPVSVGLSGQPLEEIGRDRLVRIFGTVRQEFRTPAVRAQ